ncbi:MAG: rubrerythrin family protein [Coriobacteriia bacterium]|nr:rubrerythrin family protein [Coriobacteriia bacterium]
MAQVTRRDFVKKAAVGATTVSMAGILAACAGDTKSGNAGASGGSTEGSTSGVLSPTSVPSADSASNFNIMSGSTTAVGSTYDNLCSAIAGETGASAKYAAFAEAAKKEGFPQLARLFTCTSDAEKIHIELEFALASKMDSSTTRPTAPAATAHETDINLIMGASGEMYETSDMYPSFIKKAQDEGESEAVQIFTRAKLAEAYHAERYLNAYNTIDTPDDDKYYLCPVCGYIHKGEAFTACPVCLTAKSAFKAY